MCKTEYEVIMARKLSNAGSQNLPTCAVEFIKLVIKKMRYRRKVQRDVQAELAAHFEDELKDCASDEEKEQKAQQLIAEFGDVKLLAVLLRRAKKRCRPLWRTVIARTFQTIGILILCFIVYTAWFLTGKPAISVDYLALLNQMGRPHLRDEDNAWPHYEKAITLYKEPVPGGVVRQFINFRYKPGLQEDVLRFDDLSEGQRTQVLEWIQQNQKHWDSFSPEQQKVIMKFFEYNWVPILKKLGRGYPEWGSTEFDSMVEHIIKQIKEKTQIDSSVATGGLPGLHIFGCPEPEAELKNWLKQGKIPPNFLEAVSVAVLREWMKRYKDLPVSITGPLTDTEYEYISPWVRQNEAAWQEFVVGSLKSYCYRQYQYRQYQYRQYQLRVEPAERWLLNIDISHFNTFKQLAKFGVWRSRIHVKEGRARQAIEDCSAIVRAAGHWQGKETLVEQLVGIAISALAHEEILHIIATQELSATDLKQVQQRLSQIYSQGYPLINVEGERIEFLDTVQHLFTEGGPGGGHLIPSRWDQFSDDIYLTESKRRIFMPFSTAASMVHARRDETIAKFNEIFDKLSENVKMSPHKRHIHNINADKVIFALPRHRYFLIHTFLPAFDRISDLGYRGKVSHEATVAIMALKRWRLEKNQYPANLDELVAAGFLKELLMDPYSDKPLVYKKTDDKFTLYSIGSNFIDDGGEPGRDTKGRISKWRDNGDTVFWPVPKTE